MNFITKFLKRRKHTKEVRKWRHDNNIKKSELEMCNNKLYMREYNQRPEVKLHHKLYMRKWRKKSKNGNK